MEADSTDSHIVVKPFTWDDWRTLWIIRYAQLAEDGVVLAPASIPAQPEPELEDNPEWNSKTSPYAPDTRQALTRPGCGWSCRISKA